MIDEQLFERVARRIEGYEKDMVNLQIELTAIPAIAPESGGDGEMKKAIFLWDVLARLGMTDLEIIDAPDERVSSGRRPNIIVRYPGRRLHPKSKHGSSATWISFPRENWGSGIEILITRTCRTAILSAGELSIISRTWWPPFTP
jgi:hypothetical protein